MRSKQRTRDSSLQSQWRSRIIQYESPSARWVRTLTCCFERTWLETAIWSSPRWGMRRRVLRGCIDFPNGNFGKSSSIHSKIKQSPQFYPVAHLKGWMIEIFVEMQNLGFKVKYNNPENCWVFWITAEWRSENFQFEKTFKLQGVPPGHEHLNISIIKLHSSMTFIWAYSVYYPLVVIHFLHRSIHSRKPACKVTFQYSLEHLLLL
jgi:hypothetical protein